MDIERSEWDSLPNMMDDGILTRVKQFGVEIHLDRRSTEALIERMNILTRLERLGFKKWFAHKNPTCTRESVHQKRVYIALCIEMVYINTNFLRDYSNSL